MSFESNSELFEAIDDLQRSLKESGSDEAVAKIADGVGCLNGLTDGWALLMESLENVKVEHGAKLSRTEHEALASIHACVKGMVVRV